MVGRRTKLTSEVHQAIVDAVRNGCFDWIAAQAAGIDPSTFWRWMRRGERSSEQPFRQFCKEVKQARAQARQQAEALVFKESPFKWLRYGPGRERQGEPGWTERKEHTGSSDGEPITFTLDFSHATDREAQSDASK